MLIVENRGMYDTSRTKDSLAVTGAGTGVRAAIFLDQEKSLISIAVDMPNKSGALCYSVPFDVLVDVLRARLVA